MFCSEWYVVLVVLFIVFLTASDSILNNVLCVSYPACPAGACGVYEVNVV